MYYIYQFTYGGGNEIVHDPVKLLLFTENKEEAIQEISELDKKDYSGYVKFKLFEEITERRLS